MIGGCRALRKITGLYRWGIIIIVVIIIIINDLIDDSVISAIWWLGRQILRDILRRLTPHAPPSSFPWSWK